MMECKIECISSIKSMHSNLLEQKMKKYRVYIFAANIRKFENINQFMNLLSLDEKEKYMHFKFIDDKLRFLLSHGLLRIILSKYLNVIPKDIGFTFNRYGKICISNNTKVMFNITHSRDWIMIAFSTSKNIGIDLEYVSKEIDEEEIIKAFFNSNELADVSNRPIEGRLKYFYYLWVSKEAYTKALGKGLFYSLNSFYIKHNGSNEFEIIDENNTTKHKIAKFDF